MTAPGNLLDSPTHGNLTRQLDWLRKNGFGLYWLGTLPSEYGPDTETMRAVTHPMNANLIGSQGSDGKHRVAVDIDLDVVDRVGALLEQVGLAGHEYMLTPSSTAGHWHLYVGVTFDTWDEYCQLLSQMVIDGIISPEYFAMAKNHGMTRLRRPGVRKA